MQEAWEYIKEENFQMRGSGKKKNEGKEIRTRIIKRERERERERESSVYPCVRTLSSGGLEKNH